MEASPLPPQNGPVNLSMVDRMCGFKENGTMKFVFVKTEPPPGVATSDWMDWKWQVRKSLRTPQDFAKIFQLTADEEKTLTQAESIFSYRSTLYYASLAKPEEPNDPIRRILLPSPQELKTNGQQLADPLGEDRHSPVPRLIHRYPDRVLFLVTDLCSVYCRYCTRKHFTGNDQAFVRSTPYQNALSYLQNAKGVREVILSGGDPLTLSDEILERVLSDLRAMEHLEIIRIGTRMPVVAPMRITEALAQMLRRYKPVYLMTHFIHPRELTFEAASALEILVDHGIPVFNQMVLLNGINNSAAMVQALSRRLLFLRVKPYYMFQCDPSMGSDHFRTSIEQSAEIQRELWGKLSGLAMPNLSVDIPDGGGKVGIVPNFSEPNPFARDSVKFQGFDGFSETYLNPPRSRWQPPVDEAVYLNEWQNILDQPYGKRSAEPGENSK